MATEDKPGLPELQAARRKGRGLLFWAFVFSIFVNILMLTGPLYMLQVYDRVLASKSVETLVALSLLVTMLYALMAVLDYARGRVMARIGARFQTALDARVFRATLQRSANPHDRPACTAVLRDLDALQNLFVSPVLTAIMDMPWTPLFIAAIFIFHPVLGWVALAGALIIVVLALLNQVVTAYRVRMSQIATQRAHAFAEQAHEASEVALSQGMRDSLQTRYKRLRNLALRESMNANDWTGIFTSLTKAFRLFLQSAILGLGAYFVLQGELTPGSMIAGSILLGRALAPVEQAMGNWPVLQRARAGWKTLERFLSAVPLPEDRTELPVPGSLLQANGVTIMPPGAKKPTVRSVSFTLEPGHALGIIGKSGSGKSSLARVLTGYWPMAAGEVRLGGATLNQYDPMHLGRHIGYLPQTVSLFAGTISENIRRMSLESDSKGVVEAAKQANAHEMIMQLPNGYDTYLDGNENQLSGGQRQRIALARALYGDPVLLILDEPNSMLDAEGSDALNQTVKRFKERGKAVIITTHRPAAIAECDMLIVLDKGSVVALGPRDEVLAKTIADPRKPRLATARPGKSNKVAM
ncbi:ATP-binding cassette, subfamily C [Roseovarius pacificus]|uniref:ATP-binding cassette, subfamily C n=1 Tax=Roseovarius pacificus TaxID=337701 RepID=A0A1M7HNW7_9RHOB|nr:type I secretion system permease/ATPase [Roseovarius pacificus]GGO60602.1 protease/lipase ABC transporter permease/ATP-binding protein [Roseovarius pacificus]SHM30120.1 ATP-binding cassette, subfamily C [Roseovarius pacificus]